MKQPFGKKKWAIADGYIPSWSNGPDPEMLSHETICVLNPGDSPAAVEITAFFSDRKPAGPYRITVEAERTKHVRINNLTDPEPIPPGVDFALVITADVPVVVQQTRLDSRQAENALLSTIAYCE